MPSVIQFFKEKKKLVSTSLLVLVFIGLLLLFGFLLFRSFLLVRHSNLSVRSGALHHQVLVTDPNYIEGWMTFRYINTIFKLPENYLPHYLQVTIARYPNLTLDSYSKSYHLDKLVFTEKIRQAVRDYIQTQSSK